MGERIAAAQHVLAEFVQAHRRWQRFLDAGPPGRTNRDVATMLEQLDATRLVLTELHAANEQANGGAATIPTEAELDANLSLSRMAAARHDLAKQRRHAEDLVDGLGVVVTSADLLAEFDRLPAVERLAFVNELLAHADTINEMEGDKALARVSSSSAMRRRRQYPAVLADIGDEHLLAPARIEKLARDLPLEVLRGTGGAHSVRIAAADAAAREKIESQVAAATGSPPGTAATAAWKLAAQYGNLVTTVAPVLAGANARSRADAALVALYDTLTPLLGTTATPEQIRQSLQRKQAALTQVDRDFFLRIELPLKAGLAGLDIYLALTRFFANPSAGTALQDAATAVLKATELLISAAEEMSTAGSRTAARVALRITGIVAALGLFVLDMIAAEKGISSALRHRDYSVAVGEALKAGSAALFTYSAIAVALGASATTGPLFLVVAIALALVLIGEALVVWTQDTRLEQYAAVCAFGKDSDPTSVSSDPGEVGYRFSDGQQVDIPVQLERLRTLLNPLGFTITIAAGNRRLQHSRPTGAGPAELRLPGATQITVGLVEPDGSTTPWTSTGTVPFDPVRFRTEGLATESAFHARGVVGRWMEMAVLLPGTGPARTLREYAVIP